MTHEEFSALVGRFASSAHAVAVFPGGKTLTWRVDYAGDVYSAALFDGETGGTAVYGDPLDALAEAASRGGEAGDYLVEVRYGPGLAPEANLRRKGQSVYYRTNDPLAVQVALDVLRGEADVGVLRDLFLDAGNESV